VSVTSAAGASINPHPNRPPRHFPTSRPASGSPVPVRRRHNRLGGALPRPGARGRRADVGVVSDTRDTRSLPSNCLARGKRSVRPGYVLEESARWAPRYLLAYPEGHRAPSADPAERDARAACVTWETRARTSILSQEAMAHQAAKEVTSKSRTGPGGAANRQAPSIRLEPAMLHRSGRRVPIQIPHRPGRQCARAQCGSKPHQGRAGSRAHGGEAGYCERPTREPKGRAPVWTDERGACDE
jgi:hypothetical protein